MNKFNLASCALTIAIFSFAGGVYHGGRQVKNVARNAFAAGAMTGIELQKLNAGLHKQGVAFTAKEWNDLIEREFIKKVQLP